MLAPPLWVGCPLPLVLVRTVLCAAKTREVFGTLELLRETLPPSGCRHFRVAGMSRVFKRSCCSLGVGTGAGVLGPAGVTYSGAMGGLAIVH